MPWTTPTIDNLASEGIVLQNYYTNYLCGPSRASFLTGRYSLRTGVTDYVGELPLNESTIAQELRSAGYRSYLIGKWDMGFSTIQHMPIQRGFDYFYGFLSGM